MKTRQNHHCISVIVLLCCSFFSLITIAEASLVPLSDGKNYTFFTRAEKGQNSTSANLNGFNEIEVVQAFSETAIWLETECATSVGSAWELLNDSEASGGSYLKVIPGNSSASSAPTNPNHQLSLTFSVSQAGQYTIYTRQRESGRNNDDSFWLKVNDGAWTLEGLGGPANTFFWEPAARGATYALAAGTNTITIGTREDRTQLDKIYITLAGDEPSGIGETASNCSTSDCGDIVLSTQAEVNAFDCISVKSLTIGDGNSSDSDPITNLNALRTLTTIEQGFNVGEVDELTSLAGLENLETVGGNFSFTADVSDLKGLESLRSIGGSFEVYQVNLTSFEGLTSLATIGGGFSLSEAYSMESFAGLDRLKSVAGTLFVDRVDEIGFTGLEALELVGGIRINDSFVEIIDFVGLESLKIIQGDLRLGNTDLSVKSIKGLETLEEVTGDIRFFYTGFEDLQGLSNLQRIGGNFSIGNNFSLTSLNGLESLEVIEGDLTILDNNSLAECCILTSIVDGVVGRILIESNASGCGRFGEVVASCSQGNGVAYNYYEGTWTQLPNFDFLPSVATGILSNFSLAPAQQEDYYGFQYTTFLEVTTAGEYTFYTNSDDGTKLYINDQLVVDNDGVRAPVEKSGSITLAVGRHALRVEYFEAFGGQLLEVRYAGPGISKQLIPDEVLFLNDDGGASDCGDVVLTTQSEVDAFDCTSVKSLTIGRGSSSDPITNLSALESLVSIQENFTINSGGTLTNLQGLSNLQTIGGDLIYQGGLRSFSGLDKLTSIGGEFNLIGPPLEDFEGMEALKSIGGRLYCENFYSNFTGLSSLETIGGPLAFGPYSNELSFEGLSALKTVGGIDFGDGFAENFVGLSSLTKIDGSLIINYQDGGLGSFEGLERVEEITGNVVLATFVGPDNWDGLNNLRRIGGDLILNGEMFFSFGFEDFTGLEKLEVIGGEIYGFGVGFDSFKGLSSLRSVGSINITEAGLVTLAGLEQLRQVNGDIIFSITGLTSIGALANVEFIGGDVRLTRNSSLNDCCVLSMLQDKVQGEIILENNAPGCSNFSEITTFCDEGGGVTYRYYEGTWTQVPDFRRFMPDAQGFLSNFSLTPAQKDDYYAFQYTTFLEVPTAGEYTFYTNSDDGSKLYVNDQLIVDNDGRQSAREESGSITLSAGRHALRVEYFEAFGRQLLEVRYAGPGIAKQLIPDEVLFLNDDSGATSCGDIVLTTQAEVDAFDCTSVESLTIRGLISTDPINNLDALRVLTTIEQDLYITGVPELTNLEGLNNLKIIGGSLQVADASLESFRGLDNLQAISGRLSIVTSNLKNFEGLESLERVDGIIDLIDTDVNSYQGLSTLQSVSGFDYSESFEVSDFTGLESLTTITGTIKLDGEESGITSFRGLDNVERIGRIFMKYSYITTFEGLGNLRNAEDISIELSNLKSFEGIGPVTISGSVSVAGTGEGNNSDSFIDPSALINVERIGGNLILTDNDRLSDCCVLPTLQDKVEGEIILGKNATGCNSFGEIAQACSPPETAIWLETECATSVGSAWEVLSDSQASGGSYLKALPGNNSTSSAPTDPNRQLSFTFSVSQAGQYTIYTRQRES
ncbi:MAG: PA14 domain-containing protein [Bacteroidota bacterium]